jgi:hypothetical protein
MRNELIRFVFLILLFWWCRNTFDNNESCMNFIFKFVRFKFDDIVSLPLMKNCVISKFHTLMFHAVSWAPEIGQGMLASGVEASIDNFCFIR